MALPVLEISAISAAQQNLLLKKYRSSFTFAQAFPAQFRVVDGGRFSAWEGNKF